jgi:hypothetical protein
VFEYLPQTDHPAPSSLISPFPDMPPPLWRSSVSFTGLLNVTSGVRGCGGLSGGTVAMPVGTIAGDQLVTSKKSLRAPSLPIQLASVGTAPQAAHNASKARIINDLTVFPQYLAFSTLYASIFRRVSMNDLQPRACLPTSRGRQPASRGQLKTMDRKIVMPGATKEALKDLPTFKYAP